MASDREPRQPLWDPSARQREQHRDGALHALGRRAARARASPTTASCGAGRWTSSRTSGRASGSSAACAPPALRARARRARDARRALVRGRRAQLRREPPARPAARHGPLGAPGTRGRACAVLHASELRELRRAHAGASSQDQVAAAAGGPARARRRARRPRRRLHAEHPRDARSRSSRRASIGAIWSSAAPEFGARSVIDRFAQIEPKVLLAVDGYRHGGKDFDRARGRARRSSRSCPTVEHVVLLPYLAPRACRAAAERRASARLTLGRSCCARGAGAALQLRAGALRAPAVGALLLRHDRPAEGDRARPRRDPARAAEEAPAPRPAARATACSGSRRPAG